MELCTSRATSPPGLSVGFSLIMLYERNLTENVFFKKVSHRRTTDGFFKLRKLRNTSRRHHVRPRAFH